MDGAPTATYSMLTGGEVDCAESEHGRNPSIQMYTIEKVKKDVC